MTFNPDSIVNEGNGGSYEPLPRGKYKLCVDDVISKLDKNGQEFFNVSYSIIEGEYQNRKIFKNFFVNNANDIARNLAFIAARCICRIIASQNTGNSNIVNVAKKLDFVSAQDASYAYLDLNLIRDLPFEALVVQRKNKDRDGNEVLVNDIDTSTKAEEEAKAILANLGEGKVEASPLKDDEIPF